MVNTIKILKLLHILGLLMAVAGVILLGFSEFASEVQGMVITASLIGLGLLFMSPFPIALFLEWAKKQSADDKASS